MIQTTALILGAVIVACLTFVIGLALGLLTSECYKGKRICRECMRGFAKHGFHVDGEEYEVARRIVRGAERLGKTGLGRTGW